MKKITFFFLCLFLSIGLVAAQTVKVSGTVFSEDDGEPVIGASVVVKGNTTVGIITDYDGHFTLSVPDAARTLIVSYIGMISQEIAVKSILHVVMQPETHALDEVMVVAYGTAKKSSFTGAADVVKKEQLEARTVANISKAIEGTVAGLQTTSGGGQPGEGAKIIIRGQGSINANNDPLYVLDGIPYDGDINAINPADIESMSILKDASASALYGARGANGVVMITTKKGKTGAPVVSFKALWGVSSRAFPLYDRVKQSEYMELAYESVKNSLIYDDGLSEIEAQQQAIKSYMSLYGGEMYNPFNMTSSQLIDLSTGKINPSAVSKYNDDWYDEASNNNPLRQEYQFSVSGGRDKTNYMFSLGYLDETGIALNTDFQRYSGRVNVDSQIKKWLRGGLSSSFSNTNQQYMQEGSSGYYNIWYSSTMIAPIYPVYVRDENGNFPGGKKEYDYGPSRSSFSNMNWIAALYDDKRESKTDNLSARTYLEFADIENESLGIFKDFKFTVNLGVDYRNRNRLVYQNPSEGNAAGVKGSSFRSASRLLSMTFNQLLNYNRTFDKHDVDVLAGHEYYSYSSQVLEAERQNFPFAGAHELANGASITEGMSFLNTYKIESWLSRVSYSYDDKYYLSGSFRTDGSSRFYKDSRWGQFWSVGGAWRISQEAFMKEETSDWLTNLTLKASYGVQGNDNLMNNGETDYYAWQGLYDMTYPNSNLSGAFLSSLENKGLKWEKNKNLNVGLEANLFNSRMTFSFDYFVKNTSDLLLLRPLATSTGFNGYYDNVGDMTNRGFDIMVSGDIIRKDKFLWNATLIISAYKNKITRLSDTKGGSNQIVLGARILKEGEPINSFYLPETAGVDPETGKQLFWITEKNEAGVEEKVKSDDYFTANANHRQIVGSPIPDFNGSFSNSFRYRGFDLSFMLTFSVGGKIYDTTYANLMGMRNAGMAWHTDILKRWQKPGDITDVPILQLGFSGQSKDSYLLDASYLSLKNISVGYNLPRSLMQRVGMQDARVFVTGDNLYLLSAKVGLDPQFNFTGTQDFKYSPIRTISLGIDVKF